MAAWIKMPLGMELGLCPGDFVLDGDPALPKFLAHVTCGQTAGWIKVALGMEVGLSPGDFVSDRDPAPLQFLAHFYCGQTAGCIKIPLGMEVGLTQATLLDGDPALPPQKGGEAPFPISAHVGS